MPKLYGGLGGAFTYGKEEYFGVEFSQYFYTISAVVGYKLYNLANITFDVRERIGNEVMTIGDYSSSGLIFSTDLVIGYKNMFGILAIPIFLGDEATGINARIGLGYQFNLY